MVRQYAGIMMLAGVMLLATVATWGQVVEEPVEYEMTVITQQLPIDVNSNGIVASAWTYGVEDEAVNAPILLWDMETGSSLGSLDVGGEPVMALAFSPDGETLMAGTGTTAEGEYAGRLHAFSIDSGQAIASVDAHSDWIRDVAFSPDGSMVATCSDDGTVKLWDAQTLELVHGLSLHNDYVRAVAFSPDGALVAAGDDTGVVTVCDTETGETIWEARVHEQDLNDEQAYIFAIAFTVDGAAICSTADDELLRVTSVSDGSRIAEASTKGTVSELATSPDGRLLAAAGGGSRVQRWLTGTWEGTDGLGELSPDGILSVTYSADGAHVIAADRDGVISVINCASGETTASMEMIPALQPVALACSPDGRHAVVGVSTGRLLGWDTDAGQWLERSADGAHRPCCISFGADASHVVVGTRYGVVEVYTFPDFRAVFSVETGWEYLADVGISPDGRTVTAVDLWGAIRSWDLRTGELASDHSADDLAIVEVGTGRRLVNVGMDHGTAEAISAVALRPDCRTMATSTWASALAFSPDGKSVAGLRDNSSVTIRDGATGALAGVIELPYEPGSCLAMGPNRIIAVTSVEGGIGLWGARDGSLLHELDGHSGAIVDLCFSVKGMKLFSLGKDGMVRVWHAGNGELLMETSVQEDEE